MSYKEWKDVLEEFGRRHHGMGKGTRCASLGISRSLYTKTKYLRVITGDPAREIEPQPQKWFMAFCLGFHLNHKDREVVDARESVSWSTSGRDTDGGWSWGSRRHMSMMLSDGLAVPDSYWHGEFEYADFDADLKRICGEVVAEWNAGIA